MGKIFSRNHLNSFAFFRAFRVFRGQKAVDLFVDSSQVTAKVICLTICRPSSSMLSIGEAK